MFGAAEELRANAATSSFNVGPGANDQVLHRDQTIHSVNAQEGSLYTSDVGCLVAGTRSTKKNGATRVVPGSHLWSPKRIPKVEEAASAEMEAGSAMFWFGELSPRSVLARSLISVMARRIYLPRRRSQHLHPWRGERPSHPLRSVRVSKGLTTPKYCWTEYSLARSCQDFLRQEVSY